MTFIVMLLFVGSLAGVLDEVVLTAVLNACGRLC